MCKSFLRLIFTMTVFLLCFTITAIADPVIIDPGIEYPPGTIIYFAFDSNDLPAQNGYLKTNAVPAAGKDFLLVNENFYLVRPDVQEGVQNSCSKCHSNAGLAKTYNFKVAHNASQTGEQTKIVAKEVNSFNTVIELAGNRFSLLICEYAPDFPVRENLALGVANGYLIPKTASAYIN